MIRSEKFEGGVKCSMDGKVFDLLEETTAVVDGMAHSFMTSYKGEITYEKALKLTVGTVYEMLIKKEERTSNEKA